MTTKTTRRAAADTTDRTSAAHASRANMLAALAALGLGLGVQIPTAQAAPPVKKDMKTAGPHGLTINNLGKRPGAHSYKLEDGSFASGSGHKRPGAHSFKVEDHARRPHTRSFKVEDEGPGGGY